MVTAPATSNDLQGTQRSSIGRPSPGMVDNATIASYNSDSKHRIRRTRMSDSRTKTTITLEPDAETDELIAAASPDGDAEDAASEQPAPAPERLDSPIERLDVSSSDTFIPESVDQLLAHSRRYPLLTPAQEIELAQRIERGDLHAKELLVNSNLRLVASNARRYQNQGLPLGDLVQEGM